MRHYKYKLLKNKIDVGVEPKVYIVSSLEDNGYEWYTVTKDTCTDVYMDEGELYASCKENFEVNLRALFFSQTDATNQVVIEINKKLDKE